MIFRQPPREAAVDQGDMIDGCPLFGIAEFDPANPEAADAAQSVSRVIVLTQTCDLANQKVTHVVVAVVLDADSLVESGKLKAADIRGRSVLVESSAGTFCQKANNWDFKK